MYMYYVSTPAKSCIVYAPPPPPPKKKKKKKNYQKINKLNNKATLV